MKNELILHPEIERYHFAEIMQFRGEVFRELEGRRTQRIKLRGQDYFIKQHFGIGWKEIFKNLLQGRLPIISAKNEWLALDKLKRLKILAPEVVGYGLQGNNPSSMQSFIMTRELPKYISLEDFCKHWQQCPPSFTMKSQLIKEVARIARVLHTNGINHRDFYICHFLFDVDALLHSKVKLYLIDLHRAGIRARVPLRWIIKDLAGLYFSSKDIGLTKRDILRFIREYREKPISQILNKEPTFWLKVQNRGEKLYKKHER